MLNWRNILFAIVLLPFCELKSQTLDTVVVGGSNQSYSVTDNPGSVFTWIVDGNTITSGQGTYTIQVGEWTQPGLYPIKVVEQNQLGCFGDTVLAYILVRAVSFKIDYPKFVCIGDSVTLTASGGVYYKW